MKSLNLSLLGKYLNLNNIKERIKNINFKDNENKKEVDLFLEQINLYLKNN